MLNIFDPAFLIAGAFGLLVGAGIGEFLAQKLPAQKILIAICLYVAMAVSILAGADFSAIMQGVVADHGSADGAIMWTVTRQIFMLGLLSGAALFLHQRGRPQQVVALCISAVIGLPIMMNIWMGAGITYSTQGLSA
ncbi:MAG: hypothetical protein RLN72_10895 [Henriciella sp.]